MMQGILRPLLEPILHPSRWRIRALGVATLVGHPLFYVIWAHWLPQPYERLWQRLLMSSMGLALLLYRPLTQPDPSRMAVLTFTAIFWVTLPIFFWWMYLCNDGNAVWLASLSAMFLIYYHLTDWRLATLGSVSGALVAWLLFEAFGPVTPGFTFEHLATNTVVIAFSWFMAVVLALSSANLRHEHLTHTMATMGIMAHELRTPLATMSLLGEALRADAAQAGEPIAPRLDHLATRMSTLVRNMNHQIDTQIANARLLHLPRHQEVVQAGDMVQRTLLHYPFRSAREKECVVLQVRRDFSFRGSGAMFSQVMDNLIKNALRALAAMNQPGQPGDVLIEVGTLHGRGRIVVTDRGTGIPAQLQPRIFEPFFSTDRGTGHGLGLAFCQRVIQAAHGTIRVKSEPGHGTTFTIDLPLAS